MQTYPQRLAWITMLSGLVIFILLCIGSVIFARWLVFESPTQLNVIVNVGRGTVSLASPDQTDEKAVRSPTAIGRRDRLSVDNLSQGYLAFADPYSGELLATVTLRSDSVITLANASRPRFSLSDKPYAIRLIGGSGQFEVWVREGLNREIRIDIESPMGATRIGSHGSFLIDSNPAYLKVIARDGNATLVNNQRQTQYVAANAEAVIYQEDPQIKVEAGPIDLLPNSLFGEANKIAWPVEWSCAFEPSPDNPNGPSGEYEFPTIDGRPTVHIVRLQPDAGPGETGCQQVLAGPDGLDVMEYDTLTLRVSMLVHYQKLSACGVAGSECPVMLKITYLDQNGTLRNWYHGFYSEATPNVGRTICDSCLEAHEQINKNAWYVYESGNLFTDWPIDRRPGSIISIKFYASGHQYDVMVNEVSLLATKNDLDDNTTVRQ